MSRVLYLIYHCMGIKDQKKIDELKQRLYERDGKSQREITHELKSEATSVPSDWQHPSGPQDSPTHSDITPPAKPPVKPKEPTASTPYEPALDEEIPTTMKKKKTYRKKIFLIGLGFLVFSLAIASLMTLSGNNTISGDNISVALTGPLSVGGGEVIPLQVGIINNNTVDIDSATLIVEYPAGTQSANGDGTALSTERLQLDTVAGGETLNIPLRAAVYGEENEEKEIKVSVEYRVTGSNAVFYKEAPPLLFKISSSPLSLKVSNDVKVSAGQETEITLTITSNSPTTINDVLVKADYPNSFDFTSADPQPDYSENVWRIKSLEPESSKTITLKGSLSGNEGDEASINVSVGAANTRNPQELNSIFVTDRADFAVEHPFMDISLSVNNQKGDSVKVKPDSQFNSVVTVANTLDYTIYDTVVVVSLSGSGLSAYNIDSSDGYYNASNNTITWDLNNRKNLEQITPGGRDSVSFSFLPKNNTVAAPKIGIDVKVESRRISESNVSEKLEGTAKSTVLIASEPTLSADVSQNDNVFDNYGYVPPKVGQETTYTLSYMLANGSSDISDTAITATLPDYVSWTNKTSGSGNVTYAETTRTVTWRPGNIAANASAFASFQVSITPDQGQLGYTPVLLNRQSLQATDNSTRQTIGTWHTALTTEMSTEAGYAPNNGRVGE